MHHSRWLGWSSSEKNTLQVGGEWGLEEVGGEWGVEQGSG
jgi:hypothetical protein